VSFKQSLSGSQGSHGDGLRGEEVPRRDAQLFALKLGNSLIIAPRVQIVTAHAFVSSSRDLVVQFVAVVVGFGEGKQIAAPNVEFTIVPELRSRLLDPFEEQEDSPALPKLPELLLH